MFNFINVPLGYVMRFLSGILGGNFAAAVFMFTLFIDILLIPLSIKSQKSSVQQMRIKPKLDELRRKYGDDRQKMAEAQQKLYQDEGVSMSGGCLPMLVRLVLMMSIYSLILSPLTYMAGADNDKATNVYNAFSTSMTALEKEDESAFKEVSKEISWTKNSAKNTRGNQLLLISIIRENPDVFEEVMSEKDFGKIESDLKSIIEKDKETNINYELLGMVEDYDEETGFVTVIQKNRFFEGSEVEFLMPKGDFIKVKIEYMEDEDGNELKVANRPQSKARIKINTPIERDSMMRGVREN